MPIPTESVTGCVVRQLFHGRPYLVFVENADGSKPRAVFEVCRNGPGGYMPISSRWQYHGDAEDDALTITAEYLDQSKKHL